MNSCIVVIHAKMTGLPILLMYSSFSAFVRNVRSSGRRDGPLSSKIGGELKVLYSVH